MMIFRIRLVPTIVFGVLGILAFSGGGVFSFIFLEKWIVEMKTDAELAFQYAQQVPAFALATVAGSLWVASAVSWWRGWWRLAALSAFSGCVAVFIAEWLSPLPPNSG